MHRGGGETRRAAGRAPGGLRGLLLPAGMALALAGCGSAPKHGFLPGQDGGPRGKVDVSRIPDAVPRAEPRSRYGNPTSYVVAGQRYHVMADATGYRARGNASWYGTKFHGRTTSSGEPYNMYAMTAAHKSLPLPTYVQVRNLQNGRTVVVRVNDRGPFIANRIIDLSYAAASKLGFVEQGTAPVEITAIDPYRWRRDGPQRAQEAPAGTPPATLYLQVGAFASRSNAERLRERLGGEFGSIHIHEGQSGAQAVYRVRIGPLGGAGEADAMHRQLGRHGISGATLVSD